MSLKVTSVLQPASLPSSMAKREKFLFPDQGDLWVHQPKLFVYFSRPLSCKLTLEKNSWSTLRDLITERGNNTSTFRSCLMSECNMCNDRRMQRARNKLWPVSTGKVRMSVWKRYWRENGNATGCKLCGWQKLWRRWVHPSVRSSCILNSIAHTHCRS